ncbi:hypothetical protein HY627_01165 [Candidatus Uhrbacteria bacterium]|nr:hypothetical protein [Candidatus Uhrbacteria bacterium]
MQMEYVERIAKDKSYVDTLAFRLNNDSLKRYGAGNEPSEVCSPLPQITPENISESLSNFVASITHAKGIEKNLAAKRSIAKINYAPDRITLSFVLKDKHTLAPDSKINAPSIAIVKNGIAP